MGVGCRARGPGGEAAAGAETPLEVVVADPPESLDPRTATDAVGLRLTRLVHAGLFRLEPERLAPVPWVAESATPVGPLAVRVVLREGLRFHSGRPLVADDVRATVEAFRRSRHAHVVEHVARVEVESPRALVVHLTSPHATLLTDLELPVLRADQVDAPPGTSDLDGLGPYRLVEATRAHVRLEPAEGGASPRPARGLVFRAVRDENARTLRMLSGQADVLAGGVSPALLPTFEARGLRVNARAGANVTYLLLRTDEGPFADERLRRAASLALDRAALARDLFAGRAAAARAILPPPLWAAPDASAALWPETADPAAARALVAAARPAAPPVVEVCTSTDRARRLFGRVVVQALGDVGFAAVPCALELGSLLARLSRGDFDAAVLQIPEVTEPNVLRVFLHGAMVPPTGANRGRVRDAELDALLDAGAREGDPVRRRALYGEVEARLAARVWLVPLVHEAQTAVVSSRASTFVPTPDGRWGAFAGLP